MLLPCCTVMHILHTRAEGLGNDPAVGIPTGGYWAGEYVQASILCSWCFSVLSLVRLHLAELSVCMETFLLGGMLRHQHPYVLE